MASEMNSPSTDASPPAVQSQAGVRSTSTSIDVTTFQSYVFREQELRALSERRLSDMQNQLIKVTNIVIDKLVPKE